MELAFIIFFYLFRPKQRSNVVPNAAATAGTHHGVALALAKLITACNTHTSGDDAVWLQDVDHLRKLLY